MCGPALAAVRDERTRGGLVPRLEQSQAAPPRRQIVEGEHGSPALLPGKLGTTKARGAAADLEGRHGRAGKRIVDRNSARKARAFRLIGDTSEQRTGRSAPTCREIGARTRAYGCGSRIGLRVFRLFAGTLRVITAHWTGRGEIGWRFCVASFMDSKNSESAGGHVPRGRDTLARGCCQQRSLPRTRQP